MKVWWRSKTLWLNFLALVSTILQGKYGFVVDPTMQAVFLAFLNLIFRTITKDAVGLQSD